MPELEPLYTAEEMRAAEEGHDVEQLMRRAARVVADFVLTDFPEAFAITVVCGPGNNGGDGRIAAELLREAGREVRVVESKDLERELGEPDLIVDALFGTGFGGSPRPDAARLIEQMNAAGAAIVAVDVPSGVDASTGEVGGAVVDAWATVALHGEKVGLHVTPGGFRTGYVETADIGLAPAQTRHARVTDEILARVPLRGPEDNKYTAGSVVVVGGSPGLTGAVCLAAEAAFRADAGYVAVAVPEASLPIVEQRLLEAVKRPIDAVDELAARAGALAVGPGLGRGEEQQALVRRILAEIDVPVVLDADALYELEPFERKASTVMTPHEGELARLLDVESAWVSAHRLEALALAVERFRCVVLLKGQGTLVGAPGEGVLVCPGFPSLATAGTGDVLTGIVAAFLSKGLDARIAAAAAATAHTQAAIEASQQAGLVASDLIEALPRVFP